MTLILHAEGYKSRTVVIGDMVEYAEINRTMGLVSKGVQSRDIHGLQDRDGDGIPDVYDAYPDDIESAFAYKVPARGDLTVAYEDLFGRARAGDADYNDFIARYNIEESSSGEGITKIHVDVIAAEKLAGYNHTFGIRINRFEAPAKLTRNYVDEDGNEASFTQLIKEPPEGPRSLEIVLFEHTGRALSTGNVNADFTLEFVIDGVIDNPQDPEVLSRPPYNPYLYVHNTGHDVHLIDEEPIRRIESTRTTLSGTPTASPGDSWCLRDLRMKTVGTRPWKPSASRFHTPASPAGVKAAANSPRTGTSTTTLGSRPLSPNLFPTYTPDPQGAAQRI